MNITELVREAGIYDGREGLMWCSKEQLERFAALVTAEKDKEIAELYEMSVKQAKTIKEYQDAEPVKQEPVAWMLNCQTLGGDTGWILSWTQSGAGLCNRLSGEENEKKLYDIPGAKGE